MATDTELMRIEPKTELTRTERGWAGHFICAADCLFRRNTLVSDGTRHIVVSTVGQLIESNPRSVREIGYRRFYETMAFIGQQEGPFIDADVLCDVTGASGIDHWAGTPATSNASDLPDNVDAIANDSHEESVRLVMSRWEEIHAASERID